MLRSRFARILMVEADGSPGGGAPPVTPPAAPATPPAPAFTQEQVNSVAAAARRDAEAKLAAANARIAALEAQTASAPPATPTAQPPAAPAAPDLSSLEARLVAQFEARTAIAEVAVDSKATPEQRDLLRAMYDNAQTKPADARQWASEMLTKMRGGVPAPSQPAAPVVPPPVTPPVGSTVVPVSSPGDVFSWSKEQHAEHLRKHGGDPANPYHPGRNLAARRSYRIQGASALQGMRVKVR